jgi:hypothetical protein
MSSINVDTIKSREGGPPTLSKGVVVSAAATFSTDVTIAGVLTYEDVTNVDSIGIITARSGIKFGAAGIGGTIRANGDTTLAGVVTATTFVGNLTGNPTGSAAGLTAIPGGQITGALAAVDGSALTGMANTANVSTSDLKVIGVGTFGDRVLINKSAGPVLELTTNTGSNDSSIHLHEGAVGSTSNGGAVIYSGANNKLSICCGTTLTTERIGIARDSGDVTIGTGVTISAAGICTVTTGTDLKGFKVESGDVSGGSLNGEFDFTLEDGHVWTVVGSTGGTYFPDFKVSSSKSLSSIMNVGDTVTATLIAAASNTAHYCTAGIKIDDSTSNVTVEWIGSSAPSAGKGAGYDIYTFTIVKTAATPGYLVIVNATDAG